MRHLAVFAVILLTLTGLSQSHAQSATSFPETEPQPLTLAKLSGELAGRAEARLDREPAPGADVPACQPDITHDAPLRTAQPLSATMSSRPDLQPATASNPARAPPGIFSKWQNQA